MIHSERETIQVVVFAPQKVLQGVDFSESPESSAKACPKLNFSLCSEDYPKPSIDDPHLCRCRYLPM
eukprot:Em0015g623a